MFGSKAREIKWLKGRKSALVEHLADAREELKSERAARSIIARNFSVAHEALRRYSSRLNRAVRACARYRVELAAQRRLIADQQRQLDDLLGLNHPGVEMGSSWQDRRADKRPTYRGIDETPSPGSIPTGAAAEQGEVTTP